MRQGLLPNSLTTFMLCLPEFDEMSWESIARAWRALSFDGVANPACTGLGMINPVVDV